MNYQGIIIQVIKNKAVVTTDDFQCFYIKRQPTLYVGKEIEFTEREIVRKRPVVTTIMLSAACLLLLFIATSVSNLFGVFNVMPEPKTFAYVGVDINPSLEIEIDENGSVLRLVPINEDAKLLIKELKPGSTSISEVVNYVVDKVKDNIAMDGIEDDYILFSSTLNNKNDESDKDYQASKKKLGDIMSSLKENIQDKANGKLNIYIVETDINQRKEAQSMGISTGRYVLYNKYEDLRNRFSVEKVKSIEVETLLKGVLKDDKEKDNLVENNGAPTPSPYKTNEIKLEETATPPGKSDASKGPDKAGDSQDLDNKATVKKDLVEDDSTKVNTQAQSTTSFPEILSTPKPIQTLIPTKPSTPIFWRFESYNYRGQFIRHESFIARISQKIKPLEDSFFKMVSGLADPDCISFESKNFPGYYLKHENFRVILRKDDGSASYKKDATFKKVAGLADNNSVSFQSYNFTNMYIRHRDYYLYIQEIVTELDREDATFIEVEAE